MKTISAPGTCELTPDTVSPPASAGRERRDYVRGFTLLEFLIVIVIIAILAGLALPMARGISGHDATRAAEHMALLVNQAQLESMMTSRIWKLVIDTSGNSYHFQSLGPSGDFDNIATGSPVAGEHVYTGVDLGELIINGMEAVSGGEVFLFPTGEQDTFSVTLRQADQQRTVTMDPVGPAGVLPR